jgi:outer membrane lipoprotein-sorting protein
MKKISLLLLGLISFSMINAQSVDEIIKKYTIANKLDKVGSIKTIKLTGHISMMGSELPMTIWLKNPNKIKSVTSFQGQDMIQVYDGQKGYVVNPMTGSAEPKEMTQEEILQTQRSNIFQNYLDAYLKKGQLTLDGEETVNSSPAFRIKAALEGGTNVVFFIDKNTYILVKISSTVTNGGMTVDLNSFPTDYKETNGLFIPMKTTTSAQGMEMVMEFTQVEVDIPINDSVFTISK